MSRLNGQAGETGAWPPATGSVPRATALDSELDPAVIAARVSRELALACQVDVAFLAIHDVPGVLHVRGTFGARTPGLRKLEIPSGVGLGGQVLLSHRSLKVWDYATDDSISHELAGVVAIGEGIGGLAGVPVTVAGPRRAVHRAARARRPRRPAGAAHGDVREPAERPAAARRAGRGDGASVRAGRAAAHRGGAARHDRAAAVQHRRVRPGRADRRGGRRSARGRALAGRGASGVARRVAAAGCAARALPAHRHRRVPHGGARRHGRVHRTHRDPGQPDQRGRPHRAAPRGGLGAGPRGAGRAAQRGEARPGVLGGGERLAGGGRGGGGRPRRRGRPAGRPGLRRGAHLRQPRPRPDRAGPAVGAAGR